MATTSETSGSRSRPLRPTISTGISRLLSASKTAAAWELSRVRTPISFQLGSAIAARASITRSASQASSPSYVSWTVARTSPSAAPGIGSSGSSSGRVA